MSQAYSSGKGKRPAPVYDNFLEALRGLGKDFASEAKNQIFTPSQPTTSGDLRPNESVTFNEQHQEARLEQRVAQVRQEERARFKQEESVTKEQINSIRADIAAIAKSIGSIGKEFEVAALQAPANPGIYHKHFFAQLKSFLSLLRTRVESSREWMSVNNSRSKKQGFYWGQVKNSGSKFMLSSERYTVTSTG